MTSRLFKILLILTLASLASGCKIAVMVTGGGDVTSLSGTRNCAGGDVCEIEITDPNFSDSFTAVPKPGYQFVKWQKGTGFFCGDSTNPSCAVALSGNAGVDAAIIATYELGYLMPVFKFVGIDTDGDGIKDHLDADDDNDGILDVDDNCPLEGPNDDGFGCPVADTDEDGLNDNVDPCPANPNNPCQLITGNNIVIADGKEWAQVDLFTNLSWSQIKAVCPPVTCVVGGILNGYDMTGWKFATLPDVAAMFNSYGVDPPLSVDVPDFTQVFGAAWASSFFASGWRATYYDPGYARNAQGYIDAQVSDKPGVYYVAHMYDSLNADWLLNSANTNHLQMYEAHVDVGAWFVRSQ